MTIVRDSIWSQVKPHTWKYRPRTQPITGVLLHCTRGGQWYDGSTELGAFINWERSPNNLANQTLFPPYGGMASYGTGPNRIVEVMPDGYVPAWSSHPSDEHAVSIEVAQSNLGQPIEPETIATTVHLVRELHDRHGFPLTRVYPVNDWTWSGMAGHEDTVQGKAQGKSDPGAAFWEPFMAALEGDEPMTPEERARLERVERLLAGRGELLVPVTADNIEAINMVEPAARIGDLVALTGDESLAYLDYQGNNFWLGLADTQNRVHKLEQAEPTAAPRVITITGATIKGDME